jgi:tyrosine-protein kinase Etk/Wzc
LIRIDEQNLGPVAALFPEFAGKSQVETEMLVVKTEPILHQAIEALGLNLDVREPKDLPRQAFFSELEVNRDTGHGDYTLFRTGRDRYRIEASLAPDSLIELEFSAGHRVSLPWGYFSISPVSALESRGLPSPPEEILFSTVPSYMAVEDLRGALVVSRPDRAASVFRISFDAHDPSLAQAVVNEITTAYINQVRGFQTSEARRTVAWLQEQSDQMEAQLEAAEYALQAFREGQRVVAIESEANEQVRRFAELQTQRASLGAERDALTGVFQDIEASAEGAPDFTRLVALPSFQQTDAVQTLAQSLIEAETNRTELRARWTEDHPSVVALDQQIVQLKTRLEDMGRNYLNSLNDQIASIDSVIARFGRDLERVPARELQYARLERQVALLSDLYTTLRQRLKEAEVRAEVEDSNVLVVEPPMLPWEPIHPRPFRYMALAGMAGLMLGLALAFLREQLDTVLRKEDDVGELLGLSVLSQVPRLSLPAGDREAVGGLVAVNDPASFPAEAFRALRTSVFFATQDGASAREILVTSPGLREGKSTTCSNVAIASAQQGLSTLLVDCDLRRGTLHRSFKVQSPPGMTEFLKGQLPPGELIRPTGFSNLFLAPAGSPTSNPSELLGSARFDRFLDSARKSFQVVIVDSPPVLAVTDAIVLATKIAGVVLVVRTDRTHRDAAREALGRLQAVGAGILGVVVNDTPGRGRYGYGSAYYEDLSEELKADGFMVEGR